MIGRWFLPVALGAALVAGPTPAGVPSADKEIASIDLSGPFATRSPWRFTASQGPTTEEPGGSQGPIPGAIRLCVSKDKGRSCSPDLGGTLHLWRGADPFDVPHYLDGARIVRPRGAAGRALLLIDLASQHSDNGDQRVATQVLAYDRATDRFKRIYAQATGRNNNQEIRYVAEGPLKGAIVFAEPTGTAPFGFWITVSRLTSGYTYAQALRYRSATRYGDGNRLAAIDSEMPNIQQRLGLWRPGQKLPLPARGCPHPRLVKTALWCD